MSAPTRILVATDDDAVFADVDAALGSDDAALSQIRAGAQLRSAVAEDPPDLVVCDLQIGSMGGVAATLDLRAEQGAGRLQEVPIMLLCDRDADTFLARRSGADAWLVKPIEAMELRRAAGELIGHDL